MIQITTERDYTFMSVDKSGQIGSTEANLYYPVYAMNTSGYSLRLESDLFIYYRPELKRVYSIIGKYDHLFATLLNSESVSRFEFLYKEETQVLYVLNGCIYDHEGKVLLMMTFNDVSFFYKGRKFLKNELSSFKLFVSTEFIRNEIYTNVWKRVEKDYIAKCYESDLRVEFTTSKLMEKEIFSNSFSPSFHTVDDLMRTLKEDVNPMLEEVFLSPPETPSLPEEVVSTVTGMSDEELEDFAAELEDMNRETVQPELEGSRDIADDFPPTEAAVQFIETPQIPPLDMEIVDDISSER